MIWLKSVLTGSAKKTNEVAREELHRQRDAKSNKPDETKRPPLNATAPPLLPTTPTSTQLPTNPVEPTSPLNPTVTPPKPTPLPPTPISKRRALISNEIEFLQTNQSRGVLRATPFYTLPDRFMKTKQGGLQVEIRRLEEKVNLTESDKELLAKLKKHKLDDRNLRIDRTSYKWMRLLVGDSNLLWKTAIQEDIKAYHENLYNQANRGFSGGFEGELLPFTRCQFGTGHVMPTTNSLKLLAEQLEQRTVNRNDKMGPEFKGGSIKVVDTLVDFQRGLESLEEGQYVYIVPSHSSANARKNWWIQDGQPKEKVPRTKHWRQHIVAVGIEKTKSRLKIAILDPMPQLHDRTPKPSQIGLDLPDNIDFTCVELVLSHIAHAKIDANTTDIFYPQLRRQEGSGCWVFALKDAVAFLRTPHFFDQISQTALPTQT